MAVKFKVRDLMRKRPFTKISPHTSTHLFETNDLNGSEYIDAKPAYYIITQADYMRELDPNGHKIYDETFYPDKIKKVEEEKTLLDGTKKTITKYYKQKIIRVGFPLQQLVKNQQVIHLCGNDLHHELNEDASDDITSKLYNEYKHGWFEHGLDSKWFKFCDSFKSVGDAAMTFMIGGDDNLLINTYSFLDGDTLFYTKDPLTGEGKYFVRKFEDVDTDGNTTAYYAQVWDNEYIYLFKRGISGISGIINTIKDRIGLDGYSLINAVAHGYTELPVAYYRSKEGACWSPVQDCIDMYELGFSHLCQNNLAFAFPILKMKGEDIQIQGDEMDGAVKGFFVGQDSDVDYLKAPESPESFKLQLNTLLDNIFMGGDATKTPEPKSGDTPGVSVKLYFFPSIRRAMKDAAELSDTLKTIDRLFKYGYGVKIGKVSQLSSLNTLIWAVPYVPQNEQENINNIVQMVGAGILSKETACETTGYASYDELERLSKEQKESEQSDMLTQLKKKQQQTVDIANSKAHTAIEQQKSNSEQTATNK